jgi:hypothetical protein
MDSVRVVVVRIRLVRVAVVVMVVLAEAGRLVLVAAVVGQVLVVVVPLVAVVHVWFLGRIIHLIRQVSRHGSDLGAAAAGVGRERPAGQQDTGRGDPRNQRTTRRPTHVSEF